MKYEILTPHEAALRTYQKRRHDKQPLYIPVKWMEGRHIPEGTFNEFVLEVKDMGLCITKFCPGKFVTVCGY